MYSDGWYYVTQCPTLSLLSLFWQSEREREEGERERGREREQEREREREGGRGRETKNEFLW